MPKKKLPFWYYTSSEAENAFCDEMAAGVWLLFPYVPEWPWMAEQLLAVERGFTSLTGWEGNK